MATASHTLKLVTLACSKPTVETKTTKTALRWFVALMQLLGFYASMSFQKSSARMSVLAGTILACADDLSAWGVPQLAVKDHPLNLSN